MTVSKVDPISAAFAKLDARTLMPILDEYQVPYCNERCPYHDGKRCELLGHRPEHVCIPSVRILVARSLVAGRPVDDVPPRGREVHRVMTRCKTCRAWWSQLEEDLSSTHCPCGGDLDPVDLQPQPKEAG